jgi:hypothetical protein
MWGLAIGAAMGGGIAALQHKDVLTGALMGGATGALGGALAPSLGIVGGEVATPLAVPAPAPIASSVLPEAGTEAVTSSVTNPGVSNLGIKSAMPSGWAMPSTNYGADAVVKDTLGSGIRMSTADTGSVIAGKQPGTGFFDSGIGKWVAENPGKTALGVGALGLTAFNKSGSSSGDAGKKTSYIRPYKYNQSENPEYAGAGTPYFKQSYTAQAPVNADDWGTRTMADGGIAGLAQGGQQSGLSQQDKFLGQNAIYPTSHIDHTQYATSSQLPTSAAIRDSDYDTPTTPYAGQEYTRMAEGGEAETKEAPKAVALPAAQQQGNPTLAALMAIQQAQAAQQSYQPPQPSVSQGITQPMIQPELAQIQQHYAAPQRQAPEAFQYQAPTFTKYGIGSLGGGTGVGGGVNALIDPITKQPVKSPAQIIAAAKKPATSVSGTYTGPGVNGDAESYYDRYPVADVYDYANNQPTRPVNPTSGSPEFNIPSNVPVDISSGMAPMQQLYANMGYVDYLPNPQNVDGGGGANGGLMPYNLRYAMGGGIGDLGSYSDGGRLLKGPGDGVSDDIPAQIGAKQPARLADGEFVIPARIVSELGNGSTDAGAKRLYAMMDRIQNNRRKTVGKGKVAVNSKSDKYLPA